MGGVRWLLAILLAFGCPLLAEPSRFVVRVWQSEEGLPGNAVRSVVQAGDGYLWVATAEGVVRFDGIRFSGFEDAADAAFAAMPARALFPAADGEMWVALDRGGLLRWKGERFVRILPEVNAPASVVGQVFQHGGSTIVLRGAEVWQVDGDGVREIEKTAEIEMLAVEDAAAWALRGRVLPQPPGGPATFPQLRDRKGREWTVAAAGGLQVTKAVAGSLSVPLPVAAPAYRISELAEDRDGNVWAATADSGLAQICPARVEMRGVDEGMSDRVVLPVLESRDGSVWCGGKGGKVDRITGGGVEQFVVGDGSRPVVALLEDAEGGIWAATRYGSVFRMEGGMFRPAFAAPSPVSQAHTMAVDGKAIWFGCAKGLMVMEAGQVRPIALGSEQDEITALAVDGEGVIWVGMRSGTLWHGKAGEFARHPAKPGRLVSALGRAKGGGVWVATLGAGLWHAKGRSATPIGAQQGLPDLRLTAVVEDGAGHLWLGSLAGIFRVALSELPMAADRRRATMPQWMRLDRSDGLAVRECSGNCQPSSWRGRDGRLWFPTVNGLATVNPADFVADGVAPITRVESFSVNGSAVATRSGVISTGPGETWFEARFTAFSFDAPDKVRFSHRLEGLDMTWRTTAERTVSYAAVPPGKYVFRVRAVDGDGVVDPVGAWQEIVVVPQFWQTVWFRVAAGVAGALAAGGVGLGVARARWRRRMAQLEIRHARESERARIARDLHDDLGASLTEISMLANVTAEEERAAPVRKSLEEIAEKAHSVVGALDEIVWAVNPRHDTLASVADYVAASAGEFLSTAGVALRLEMPREYPEIAVEAERRHAILLSVREALNNVVKHSGAREVRLSLAISADAIAIEISDNGRGFAQQGVVEGEGLRNLRHRLVALGGECRIESSPGAGTKVGLHLPLVH